MRIAFLTLEYPLPGIRAGGIGTWVAQLARRLAADGHEVHVVLPARSDVTADGNVRVHAVAPTRLPKLGWLLNRRRLAAKLRELVARHGVQIVETHDWCGPSAGMKLPVPLVVRCHGSDTYFGSLLGYSPRASVRRDEHRGLHGADAVAAVSRGAADRTAELFGLTEPVTVIHNGIDVDEFAPRDGVQPDADRLLYVGTLVRKKGVLDLCAAFNRVADQHPTARLDLVGNDSADKVTGAASTVSLCESLLQSAARDRVRFVGPVPPAQVANEIRRASACVFPSLAEALPMAWIEAMAAARPVIGYDSPWARDLLVHDESGIIVPSGDEAALADAMLGLLRDAARRTAIGNAARERAQQHFTIAHCVQNTLAWYDAVLKRAPRSTGTG